MVYEQTSQKGNQNRRKFDIVLQNDVVCQSVTFWLDDTDVALQKAKAPTGAFMGDGSMTAVS